MLFETYYITEKKFKQTEKYDFGNTYIIIICVHVGSYSPN